MIVEKIHNGIRYTLTNDGIVVGDKTYPILRGRCMDNGEFIVQDFQQNRIQ